jgi:hypothetical protein
MTKYFVTIGCVIAALLVVGFGIMGVNHLTGHSTVPQAHSVQLQPQSAPSPTPKPVAVVQPPSAKDVAGQLNCTSFTDQGKSQAGGVIDSGTCYIDGAKYGIDTFASKSARDAWLVAAENYGVSPKWETDTSVTYASVNS